MSTYIAIVFSSGEKAHTALRTLWDMDVEGELTVHGAAIVRRDDSGRIHVASRHTDIGTRTFIGVGIGALLGFMAGPIGVAAGAAAVSVGAATGLGALAGGAIGATVDALTEDRRENAADEAFFTLGHGQSAVVAEITEDWAEPLNDAMEILGGKVFRRENTAETNAAFGPHYYGASLYPYYYEPYYS